MQCSIWLFVKVVKSKVYDKVMVSQKKELSLNYIFLSPSLSVNNTEKLTQEYGFNVNLIIFKDCLESF